MQQFNEARPVIRDLIYKSRTNVLKAKVIESAGDSKKMWNTARQRLHSTPASMPGTFCQFFTNKVACVQQEIFEISQTMNQSVFQTSRPYTGSPLVAFPDVSSATSLLKSCANVFAPLIAHLTNCSFTEGMFPTLFKTAHVSLT